MSFQTFSFLSLVLVFVFLGFVCLFCLFLVFFWGGAGRTGSHFEAQAGLELNPISSVS